MSNVVFYANTANDVASNRSIDDRYSCEFWRPSLNHIAPQGVSNKFLAVWWLLHWLRLFANRDYCLFLIRDGKSLVHVCSVFPRYFRFPFMGKDDLAYGMWTHKEHRGKSIAPFAIQEVMRMLKRPGRRFWHVTEEGNVSSIRVAEKAGFVKVGEGRRISRFGFRALGAFILERKVASSEIVQKNGP